MNQLYRVLLTSIRSYQHHQSPEGVATPKVQSDRVGQCDRSIHQEDAHHAIQDGVQGYPNPMDRFREVQGARQPQPKIRSVHPRFDRQGVVRYPAMYMIDFHVQDNQSQISYESLNSLLDDIQESTYDIKISFLKYVDVYIFM